MQVSSSEKVLGQESQRKAPGLTELLLVGGTFSCGLLGSDVNTFYSTCRLWGCASSALVWGPRLGLSFLKGNKSPALGRPGGAWVWGNADPASPLYWFSLDFFSQTAVDPLYFSSAIKAHRGPWPAGPFDSPGTTAS